jgi:hypothetical protein
VLIESMNPEWKDLTGDWGERILRLAQNDKGERILRFTQNDKGERIPRIAQNDRGVNYQKSGY